MAPASEKSPSTRAEWVLAILVTLVIVGLHLHFWQQAGGLWRDEVNLVNLAASPTLADMTRDSFPVLMPLLVVVCVSSTLSWMSTPFWRTVIRAAAVRLPSVSKRAAVKSTS